MLSYAVAISALASLAGAVITPEQLATLAANFQGADLGALIDKFEPQGILEGTYASVNMTPGVVLTTEQAANFPELVVNPVNGTGVFANADSKYTAILVDAGTVGTNLTNSNQTLHWLINNIHVNTTTENTWPLNYTGGTTVTDYAGPNPPSGAGPHRYALMLFAQPGDFVQPAGFNMTNKEVGPIELKKYVTDAKLAQVVAANYFTVQNGPDNATLTTTSAVDTATVSTGSIPIQTGAAPGSDGGNGAGGDGNGTATGTGADASSTSAPAGGSGSAAGKVAAPMAFAAVVAAAVAAVL